MKNKKTIFVTTLFLLLALFQTPVMAESGNDSGLGDSLRERIKERLESVKEEVQERRENQIQVREERRDQRAENHATRLRTRFDFYYQRLTKVIAKVQTRLDTLLSQGKDIKLAQDKLNQAKAKLEEAKKLGDEAIAMFEAIKPETYQEQRDQALKARDKANEARKAFIATIALIKEAVSLGKSL